MSANETPLSDVRFLTVAEVIRVGRSFRVPEQAVNQYLRDSFVAAS